LLLFTPARELHSAFVPLDHPKDNPLLTHSFISPIPFYISIATALLLQTRRTGANNLVMRARVCDLLGKTPNRQARVVTFSHKRVKKVQHVNLQWKRFFSEDLKRNVRLRVSTKGIKTINKMGSIDAAAKKFELNLKRF
jgi:large subunit ribosomal protein L28